MPVSPQVSIENDTTPLPKRSEPSGFLFVNETGGARSYKLGNRQDVRAHIRRVSAKQFHTTHKGIKTRDARLPKYAPLTTRGAAAESSKKVEHDKSCSKSGFKTEEGSRSVSNASMLGIQDPLTGQVTETTQLEFIPKSTDLDRLHGHLRAYCAACGRALSRPQARKRLLSQHGSLVPVKPKPPDIVKVLGAGRLDPFSSLPMDESSRYSHELLDHGRHSLIFAPLQIFSFYGTKMLTNYNLPAVTYALPGLWPDEAPPGEANPLSKAWFMSSLRMPLLFHALIYSGSNHLDFMRYSNIYPNAAKPLSHKLIVIHKLNEALSDPNLATRDEVILAILILAFKSFIGNRASRILFNSPWRSLGWLNVTDISSLCPSILRPSRISSR